MEIKWQDVFSGVRPDALRLLCAAAGAVCAWFSGLPPLAQALLIVQGADVLTGVLLALLGRSTKTQSGRVSSGALTMGLLKKGLEWLVVGICLSVGDALSLQGISGASMTYMIAAELVSLAENLDAFGLKVPMLNRLLDAAQKENGKETGA